MRVSTAVAALAGQVFATQEEHCGTAAVHDHTALLQNLLIQTHVAVQAGDEQHKTSADHVFDQAAAVLQNVQNTPGIATFADDIRSQITADDGFLAAIQAAHNADQLELDGLWAEVVSSMNAATDKITEIESMQLDVGIVATSHVTCREDESPLCMEAEACHVRLEAAEAELTTAEAVVSSTQTAIKTSWCGNDMSMQLDFRDAARPILSTYLGEEIIADTKREARDAIQLECDGKEVLRLAKRGECNSVQVNFEAQSCQLATFFSHSLDLAEQQVHAATTAYQTARTDVEAQEEIRKKEFLTLTRTECLLDRIHEAGELPCDENQMTQNDVAAQANACHNIEVDTSSLNIMYHDAEDVPAFPPVPSAPCSGDFMSSHYDLMDSLSSCGGPQDCAPCETAPPPPAGPEGWTLVLQYGLEPYQPTSAAVGVPSEAGTDFAKLSDATINSLPSDGSLENDYYMLTSDSHTSSERNVIFYRGQGVFDDTARQFGLEWAVCMGVASIGECTAWRSIASRFHSFDTWVIGVGRNDCERWFVDYGANPQCYRDATGNWGPRGKRCFSNGAACLDSNGNDHAMRTHLKMYKLTSDSVL